MSEKAAKKAAKKAPRKRAGTPKKASRRRAPKEESEETPKETEVIVAERAQPPVAMVQSRHELNMHERRARGFSLTELGSAGITLGVARDLDLRVDVRRRSMLEANVARLKSWYIPEPKRARAETTEEAEKEEKPKKRAPKKTRPAKAKKE